MRHLVLVIVLMVSGCGGLSNALKDESAGQLSCKEKAECDRYWQRAQRWIAENSYWQLNKVTPWAIETSGPSDYRTAPSITLLMWPHANGSADITIKVNCSLFLPCVPGPGGVTEKLLSYMTAS
jgi:uncharacterized protein YceK